MTKSRFTREFANYTRRTYTESKEIIDDIIELIARQLMKGDTVDLYGFGKFYTYLHHMPEHSTPTGTYCPPIDKMRVKFKCGQTLINLLNAEGGPDV